MRTLAGGSTTRRAATSSIASGRPSSRWQIYGRERRAGVLPQHDPACRRQLGEEIRRIVEREWAEGHDMLCRETKRDPTRREELHVSRPVEQSTDVSGGRGQVLEVVRGRGPERARAGQGVADRVDQRLVGRLRNADRARDRAGHEVGIGHRSQSDEVHGTLDGRRTRDLEREPALPPAPPGPVIVTSLMSVRSRRAPMAVRSCSRPIRR